MNYKQFTELKLILVAVLIGALAVMLASCSDDDEKPKTIPEVTTAAITEFTTTTATGGGTIVSNGNATITASGLVYSSTNTMPTTADLKTTLATATGSFTSELTGLTSGTPYHVRAYATNSVGTAYGNVVTFTTGNSAPVATNVSISGDLEIGAVLTATYTYFDAEGDAESGTTFQWYTSDTADGAKTPIEGATTTAYTILATDEFKFFTWGILPRAATGTAAGVEAISAAYGPVPEAPETVTFTYNGETVTYEVIVSSVTGRKWFDRNLGAPNKPTAVDDYANYGDLFQWGRKADGHQLIIRTDEAATTTSVHGTTTTLADSDTPTDPRFILSPAAAGNAGDWRLGHNDNLWQGVDGINNPCPEGWRIPTKDEWAQENIIVSGEAFDQLNITGGGTRSGINGAFSSLLVGRYWTSTQVPGELKRIESVYFAETPSTGAPFSSSDSRRQGNSCRCIKD